MVGLAFGFKQLGPPDLALRVELATLRLFVVRQAARHGACGDEHGGKVGEGECADRQAGHDLVAHAKIDRGVEHVVAQRNRRRHGDHVTAEQRELHTRPALRNAIAHGWHTACHLRYAPGISRRLADEIGKPLERLMCGKHIVVGGHDAEVRHDITGQLRLGLDSACRKAMREIRARERGAMRLATDLPLHPIEVAFACRF